VVRYEPFYRDFGNRLCIIVFCIMHPVLQPVRLNEVSSDFAQVVYSIVEVMPVTI
jgi:hypothetical protein